VRLYGFGVSCAWSIGQSQVQSGSVRVVYQAILLDAYGTLVHDDEDAVDDVCVQVAELIAVEPSAIAASGPGGWRRAPRWRTGPGFVRWPT